MKNNKIGFITLVGVMSAISIVLAIFIHFPIIPSVPFLEYDPADILIYLVTFVIGLPAGLIMTVIVSIIQGLTVSLGSGIIGIIMHIVATGTYVLFAGMITNKNHKMFTVAIATGAGILGTTLIMIPWNIIITPIFMGGTVEEVFAILALIILFNIIKAGVNGILAALLVKPTDKLLKATKWKK